MRRSARSRTPLFLLLSLALSGCAVAGHTSSPWEFGGGVRVAPGWPVRDGTMTAHPMFSYTYLDFEGGHDSLWELGGQVRKPIEGVTGRPFWLGAEAALAHLNTVVDIGLYDYSTSTNGVSLTALAGLPLGQSRWGFNLYGGMGISHYGSTGFNVRAGVDLQPWFLRPN